MCFPDIGHKLGLSCADKTIVLAKLRYDTQLNIYLVIFIYLSYISYIMNNPKQSLLTHPAAVLVVGGDTGMHQISHQNLLEASSQFFWETNCDWTVQYPVHWSF